MEEILNKAEIIYNYLNTKDSISKSDVILGCGSIDTTIVEVVKELDDKYNFKTIIFSGYKGKGTLGKIKTSEARRFKEYALKLGINNAKIELEEHAKTTKQNIRKSLKKVNYSSLIIVHKPYALKRTKLICQKYNINCNVTSVNLSLRKYINKVVKENNMSESDVINEIVGEIFMLKHYKLFGLPKIEIDDNVLESYKYLKKKGYRKYTI